MTASYQSIGAKVDSVTLGISSPQHVPLTTGKSNHILLYFRAYANLILKPQDSAEEDVYFHAPADIFIPVVLQQTSIAADEVCGIIRSRLFGKTYALNLKSLTPLNDVSNANAYKLLEGGNLSTIFARYFSPDSTVVPAFVYTPDPTATFFDDLKDVLRPMA